MKPASESEQAPFHLAPFKTLGNGAFSAVPKARRAALCSRAANTADAKYTATDSFKSDNDFARMRISQN